MQLKTLVPIPLIVILIATAAIYFQTRHFDFVSWDDPNYVVQNTDIHNGFNLNDIKTAFTSTRGGMWLPMVWLSYMVDIELFGVDAGAMHLINVLIHLINTALIFFLLVKMTHATWPSLLVAGLFALHPLRVESVVWITERKDVLSMLFFLLTLIAYYYYALKPSITKYISVAFLYALGLMAKPMLVTLPLVLLLLDYWPLNRLFTASTYTYKSLLLRGIEKLPLLLLAILVSILTITYQGETGATQSLTSLSLFDRIGNAIISYLDYLEKTFLPINLAFFYPLRDGVDILNFGLSTTVLVVITVVVFSYRDKMPYLVMGWLWYLGTLFPVSGIAQAGLQAMADRFSYIPLIGIFIMLAWSLNHMIEQKIINKKVLSYISIGVLAILTLTSYQQISYWQNDKTLFSHAVDVTDNNYLAQINLAGILEQEGEYDRAIELAQASLTNKPDQVKPYIILGKSYLAKQQARVAVNYLSEASVQQPDEPYIYYLLGNAQMLQQKPEIAIRHYNTAIRLDRDYWEAHHRAGIAYASLGNLKNALLHFERAVALNPDNNEILLSLAIASEQVGDINRAKILYTKLLNSDPNNILSYKRLSSIYYREGNKTKTIELLQEIVRRNPNDSETLNFLRQLQ